MFFHQKKNNKFKNKLHWSEVVIKSYINTFIESDGINNKVYTKQWLQYLDKSKEVVLTSIDNAYLSEF